MRRTCLYGMAILIDKSIDCRIKILFKMENKRLGLGALFEGSWENDDGLNQFQYWEFRYFIDQRQLLERQRLSK